MPKRAEIVVEGALLALILIALAATQSPGFRGGLFIAVSLGVTALLLAAVLAQELVESGEARPAYPGWRDIGLVFWFSALFVAPIVVLGMYFGTPVGVAWLLRRWCGAGWPFTALFSLGLGAGLPLVFAEALSMRLWPGVLPEIIPDILGGGILPPL